MLRKTLIGFVVGLLLSFSLAAAAEDLSLTGTITPQETGGGGGGGTLAVVISPAVIDLTSTAGESVDRLLTFENVGTVSANVELEDVNWNPDFTGAGLADPDITQDTPVYPDIPDMVGDYYARPFDPQPRPQGWKGTRLLLSLGNWQFITAQAILSWGANIVTVTKENGKYRALPVLVVGSLAPGASDTVPVMFRSHPELANELNISGAYMRFRISGA